MKTTVGIYMNVFMIVLQISYQLSDFKYYTMWGKVSRVSKNRGDTVGVSQGPCSGDSAT